MAQIDASTLAAAARALMLAGQWDRAAELLAAATTAGEPGEQAVLAVAAAEVGVDQDFWLRTRRAFPLLDTAAEAVAMAGGPGQFSFDLEFLRLRHDYGTALFDADGQWIEPSARDPRVVGEFADRAARLRSASPDTSRGGYVTFYAGLIEQNLRGDHAAAAPLYAEALRLARAAGDELTESYALRHLGYLASKAGDRRAAREQWDRSTELRMRAGCVPMVLAQQAAQASALRAEGDAAGSRAIAIVVQKWSRILQLDVLAEEAAELASAE